MVNITSLFTKNNSSIPLVFSTILHLSIFALLIWKTSEAVVAMPQQQMIVVELMAMQESMPAAKPESLPEPQPTISPKPKNPELVTKKQKTTKPKVIEQETKQEQSLHDASGESQSESDVTQNAVTTEPVFNAAYLNNPPPVYPQAAKRQNIEGEVLLKVEVSEEGKAGDVSIAKSSGSSLLDEAALNAVKKWRFIPAKHANKTVAASVVVPIVFRIRTYI